MKRLPFKPLPVRTLPKRIVKSIKALAHLLYFRPAYLFLTVAVSMIFYEIVFWSLNIGLLHYLLTTEYLSFLEKVSVVLTSYSSAFTLPLPPISFTLFLVSILQGMAVSSLVYITRRERATNRNIAKDLGGTGAVGALSILGLGCVPCGTSIVTPILTFFFATSSAAIAEEVGFYSAVLALVVSTVTVYLAGYKLSARLPVST